MTRETLATLLLLAAMFGTALADTGYDTPAATYPCGLTEEALRDGIWGLRQPPAIQYAPSSIWGETHADLLPPLVSTGGGT